MSIDERKKLSTSDIAWGDREHRSDAREVADRPADAPRDIRDIRDIDEAPAPLFANEDSAGYRTRWSAIQTGFVDEPRKAVEEADALVAEVMKRLAEVFATERRQLESEWERADQISTEDLRIAMRRYRSFFERLLSV
jgi:hypothetical protein